jgi:hypothetical protein
MSSWEFTIIFINGLEDPAPTVVKMGRNVEEIVMEVAHYLFCCRVPLHLRLYSNNGLLLSSLLPFLFFE